MRYVCRAMCWLVVQIFPLLTSPSSPLPSPVASRMATKRPARLPSTTGSIVSRDQTLDSPGARTIKALTPDPPDKTGEKNEEARENAALRLTLKTILVGDHTQESSGRRSSRRGGGWEVPWVQGCVGSFLASMLAY